MIGKTLSHYKILEKLGEGGMGEVYLAEDTRLRRKVALKFLPSELSRDEETRARFEREAQATAALDHPNIVTIHEIEETHGQIYISMEYVEGKSLRDLINRRELSFQKAVDLAIQMCEGLSKAHQAGIIHRDIKPENILVNQDGRVKILDFGLAKLKGAGKLTREVSLKILGTIGYTSPEQLRGETIDHRADIWSLGVVLYEMFTGKSPFDGDFKLGTQQTFKYEPEAVSDPSPQASQELEMILKKALQEDRNERYQQVEEVWMDLKRLKTGWEGKIREEEKRKSERKGIFPFSLFSFSPFHLAFIAGLLMLLLGIGFYLFWNFELQIPGSGNLQPTIRTLSSLDRHRIAVLPFEDFSPDPEGEYFADGMTEELISTLSRIGGLRVIARTSMMQYKGADKTAAEIGRELKVGSVLEGSVRKTENTVRINVKLINTQSQELLWSQDYDRELKDVFVIQSDIAQQVAEALKMQLMVGEKQRIEKKVTTSLEAYTLYLKGRYYWNQMTGEGLKKSIEYFEQALEKDPSYALTYAGLADTYGLLGYWGYLPANDAYPKAKAAAMKALEIDSTLAEAHTSLAWIKLIYDWDWPGSESAFRLALIHNPSYATAHYWYALYLAATGQLDAAIAEIKRAQELDPLSLIINTSVGFIFYLARQYDPAIEHLQKAIEMDPNFVWARFDLGHVYLEKKMYEEAIAEFQKEMDLTGGGPVAIGNLGYAYAVSGRKSEAQKMLDTLKEKANQGYVPFGAFAWLCIGLGEKDQAFEWLQKAYEERSSYLLYLKVQPLYDNLRADPRFTELLKKMGLEKP